MRTLWVAAIGVQCMMAAPACTAELGGPLHETSSGGALASGGVLASGGASGGVGTGGHAPVGGSASGSGGAASTGGAADIPLSARELPCDIQDLLIAHCEECHVANIPGRIVTHDDLLRTSLTDPLRTIAEVALERIQMATTGMMPPEEGTRLTSEEIAAFEAYVTAGTPVGTCSGDVPIPDDPFDVPEQCTSDSTWTGGNRESPLMNPGEACITCHTEEHEGPRLTIAGTLFPSAHEPDDCNGQKGSGTVYIEVTDASGKVFKLTPNAAGNFLLENPSSFTFPYKAKVVADGDERVMVEAQDNGDCNSCHTQDGDDGAPGRIILP